MTFGQYKHSRNGSWDCIIRNRISRLPVMVADIAESSGIGLCKYSGNKGLIKELALTHLMENDAFLLRTSKGEWFIFYDDSKSKRRIRFTIAHELGHYFLGHKLHASGNSQYSVLNRDPHPDDDLIEQEANVFASRLLAPACVLWALNIRSAYEISRVANISLTAAIFRKERMDALYAREREWFKTRGRSCFLCSSMERRVYKQFKPFIEEYRRIFWNKTK